MGKNCAVAIALRQIFPDAHVSSSLIFPFGTDTAAKDLKISLPVVAQQFIKLFDGFHLVPNVRLLLPAFEFDIEVPDDVIDAINIDDITALLTTNSQQPVSINL